MYIFSCCSYSNELETNANVCYYVTNLTSVRAKYMICALIFDRSSGITPPKNFMKHDQIYRYFM